jgi:hypothetical protein
MVKCKKCGQEIEWRRSESTGKMYPINIGTKAGDDNYFHSSTCKTEEKHFATADTIKDGNIEFNMRKLAFLKAFEYTMEEFRIDNGINFYQTLKINMEEFLRILGGYNDS